MINTLLEHVPIKMEVKDNDETADNAAANAEVAEDDDRIDETDEELDEEDEDEEESDTEIDALEIEQQAIMLISSDEEAELEAQRIRFPNVAAGKKVRKESSSSTRSSSRNSQTSSCSSSSNPHITYEIITRNPTINETDNKQRISPLLKNSVNNKTAEICNKENKNNTPQTKVKSKTENSSKLENNKTIENNKNKQDEASKRLDKTKTTSDINKNSENTRNNREQTLKSPANATVDKSRRGSNNSACSVASTVASENAETESCGNIYVFNLQQKLIFNCEFCDLKYGDLANFGRHLHEAHKVFNLHEGAEKENSPGNLSKNHRICNNNAPNVKKEPLQCLEVLAEPPVALPASVLAEPLDSCGNVFMLNHRKLFLVCGYCDCKYANLDLFEKHLTQQHRIFEGCRNELNVVPKVEVKEEVFIITEVVDNPNTVEPHAMVSIPAEIPLNISDSAQNDETITALEEGVETSVEGNKEQPTPISTSSSSSSSSSSAIVTENLNSEDKVEQNTSEVNVDSLEKKGNEIAEIVNKEVTSPPKKVVNNETALPEEVVNKELSLPKEVTDVEVISPKQPTKAKRPASVPLEAQNKKAKIEAPNSNTNVQQESIVTETADEVPATSLQTTEVTKANEIPEPSETKETQYSHNKCEEAAESIKVTSTEIAEIQEKNKPIKSTEESKKETKVAQTRKTSIQETNKSEEMKSTTIAAAAAAEMTTKIIETRKRTVPEIISTKNSRKDTKSPQMKKLKEEEPEIELVSNELKFQCSICLKELASKYSLILHERTHTGSKPYECDVCHKSFGSSTSLSHHKKFHADDDSQKIYKCKVCDVEFFHSYDCKEHMSTHFKCDICLRGYSSKGSLRKHIERDHKADKEATKCRKKSARTQDAASRNLEKQLEPQLTTISSSIKETTEETPVSQTDNVMNDFDTDPVDDIIEQLQNEMAEKALQTGEIHSITYTVKAVESENEVKVKSLKTGSVNSDAELNETDTSVKGKTKVLHIIKKFFCDVCPSAFEKKVRLLEHKRVHTGEKPFACDECDKQFRVRIRLKEHKLRHTNEKKFKCEVCGLGCFTKQDLHMHMRHHSNDRRYQCILCPKAFVRSSDLKIHARIHTGEKPYVCDICHKCFRANQNLCVHKKSHLGEASRIYKCDRCDKKFLRNIDRKVHMRSHTGEKPFKCEVCQRGFSSKVNVRAHIEREHISEKTSKSKKKPGPKPQALREEIAKQRKLIQELQSQLWQQIQTDEKIIRSDEEMLEQQQQQTLHDSNTKANSNSPPTTTTNNDPIQSAYELLDKLKSTTTSKPLTVIPSPPPEDDEPPANLPKKSKKDSTTLLPLTITQKLEHASPALSPATSSSSSTSRISTPSPSKTTSTKVVSQKTSLGIQQVSVTVSMQVENVTPSSSTPEKENAGILTTCSSSTNNSVKKERKITSYFTVVGQKAEV